MEVKEKLEYIFPGKDLNIQVNENRIDIKIETALSKGKSTNSFVLFGTRIKTMEKVTNHRFASITYWVKRTDFEEYLITVITLRKHREEKTLENY